MSLLLTAQIMLFVALLGTIILLFLTAYSLKQERSALDLVMTGSFIYRDLDKYVRLSMKRRVLAFSYFVATLWVVAAMMAVIASIG